MWSGEDYRTEVRVCPAVGFLKVRERAIIGDARSFVPGTRLFFEGKEYISFSVSPDSLEQTLDPLVHRLTFSVGCLPSQPTLVPIRLHGLLKCVLPNYPVPTQLLSANISAAKPTNHF
jgi:hypothetical protein